MHPEEKTLAILCSWRSLRLPFAPSLPLSPPSSAPPRPLPAAKEVVQVALDAYQSLLDKLGPEERGKLERSMGLKMEQLKVGGGSIEGWVQEGGRLIDSSDR